MDFLNLLVILLINETNPKKKKLQIILAPEYLYPENPYAKTANQTQKIKK